MGNGSSKPKPSPEDEDNLISKDGQEGGNHVAAGEHHYVAFKDEVKVGGSTSGAANASYMPVEIPDPKPQAGVDKEVQTSTPKKSSPGPKR